MRGDAERQAGAVVEPGQDLGVLADLGVLGQQRVVGEIGLPGLVRHLGFEADVGRLGFLLRLGRDESGFAQMAADRCGRDRDVVMLSEVPGDRVGAGVQTNAGELAAQLPDQFDRRRWCRCW